MPTETIQFIAPKTERIPEELKQQPWGVWKGVPRPNGKIGKPPCNPSTGRKIGTNKAEQWGTYDEAVEAFEKDEWDGIGVLMTIESGLVGFDIDDAKKTLANNPELKAACEHYMAAGGYMEKSPSGTGLRGFARGILPADCRKKVGNVEIYSDVRFLTVTGTGVGQIITDQGFIDRYILSMGGSKVTPPPSTGGSEAIIDATTITQIATIAKAERPDLWAGNWEECGRFPSQSEADQSLANTIARLAANAAVQSDQLPGVVEAIFSESGLGQRDKWTGRADYRQRTVQNALSNAGTHNAEEGADASGKNTALDEFSERYFVAPLGGDTLIFDRQSDNLIGNAMSPTAFHHLYANRKLDGKPVSKTWFTSKSRRTYEAVTFDPAGTENAREFNQWRGLSVKPKPGNCKRILQHIRSVWCSRSSVQFKYTIRWLAMMVQCPWRKPEVAIVLRSIEGTGKTMITDVMMQIFGRNAFTAAQTSQVMGQFNGHLMDKILVVLEEAFFAGDPRAEAAAKVLISNPHMTFEFKGKDPVPGRSYHHVMILSNRDWAVPAGADARRYAVLDVSSYRKTDWSYFGTLAAEIENGGIAAFLHFLLRVNLSGFNPRDLPNTASTQKQRVETVMHTEPLKGWWLIVLADGEFPLPGGAEPWGQKISAGDLEASYTCSTGGSRKPLPWPVAMRQLKKLLPTGSLIKSRPSNNLGGRHYEYSLPALADARAKFTEITGIDPTA